jgi:hypothetical protein
VTTRMLADGAGNPLDQGVATVLFLAAALFGWIAVARLRGRSYVRLPRPAGWASAALAGMLLILVAEFVAVDHAPFDPRVQASVAFTVNRG